MKTPIRKPSLLLAVFTGFAASALCGGVTANGEVIYRETFGWTGANVALNNVGWKVATGAAATDYSSTVDTINGGWISNANGAPQNLPNVDAGSTSASEVQGIVGVGLVSGNNRRGLAFTNEFSFNLADYETVTFSWYQGNANIANKARVALQIDGTWYASASTFSNSVAVASASGFATGAELKTYDLVTDASAWTLLNFTPGSTLNVGTALSSPLPKGEVTAFGLYIDSTTSAGSRFDTFSIAATAVPEPGTVSALFVGAGALLVWAQKGRKASGNLQG